MDCHIYCQYIKAILVVLLLVLYTTLPQPLLWEYGEMSIDKLSVCRGVDRLQSHTTEVYLHA